MQGNIYVTGGGTNAELSLVNKRFLADIPQGGRVLYVPYAMKNESRLATCVETFHNMLVTQNRTDIVFDAGMDLSFFRELTSFHAVYIDDGDADILMNEFDRTGFEFVLENFSRHGGIIYANDSAAITMGKYIDTCREVNQEFKTGCGLLGKFSIYPQYRDEDKTGWAPRHDSQLLCIPSGVGMIIKDGKIDWYNSHRYKIFEH
jgi:hypothetical protein